MPAAAVIPAPIAYIKVVVVKKLVVGSQLERDGPLVLVATVSPSTTADVVPMVLFAECHRRSARLL